jgi:transposase
MLKQENDVPPPPLVGIHPNPGPGRRLHLSEEERWRVVFLRNENKLTPNQIATKMKIKYETVTSILNKYEETGTVHDLPHSGRKRKLDAKDDKKILQLLKKKKCAPEISRNLEEKVSARTIRRRIKELGFFYGRVITVEALTEAHKARRVEYCEERLDFDYSKVLFSDEKTFQLGAGPEFAWQRHEKREVREYVKHAPKLHVWGAIGSYGKTELYFFQENMDSDLYIKILKKLLKEKMITYSPDCRTKGKGKWLFLQDNSAVHKSKKSMEVVEEIVGERLISHPAKSPDLNPMEDIWSYLDRKVKAAKVTGIRSLKTVLKREWDALPWTEIRKSVSSMRHRLELCIESGGKRLPY